MRIVIFMFILLFSLPALAQVTPDTAVQNDPPTTQPAPPALQSDEVYDMASTFMACSGLYEVFSTFTRSRRETELANSYQELSLAAKTAAAMTASMITDPYRAWAFAESLRRVQITFWRTLIRTEGFQSYLIRRQFDVCNRLNDLQEVLVRQYRMQTFGLK